MRAVKTIQKAHFKAELDLFRHEISIMQKLDHPSLVKFYGFYESPKLLFMVMELCEGGELFDFMRRKFAPRGCLHKCAPCCLTLCGRIRPEIYSEQQVSVWLKKVCEGLAYVHSRRIVHADIKPQNIMLKRPSCDARGIATATAEDIRIIDFGLASVVKKKHLVRGQDGTPEFMAPEVVKGKYTFHSDMWSFGVLIFTMLCGFSPFWTTSVYDTYHLIVDHGFLPDAPTPGFGNSFPSYVTLSPLAKDLIIRLLRPDPVERLSATEALQHPWFTRASSRPLTAPTLRGIEGYAERSRLYGLVMGMLLETVTDEDLEEWKQQMPHIAVTDDKVTYQRLNTLLHPADGRNPLASELLSPVSAAPPSAGPQRLSQTPATASRSLFPRGNGANNNNNNNNSSYRDLASASASAVPGEDPLARPVMARQLTGLGLSASASSARGGASSSGGAGGLPLSASTDRAALSLRDMLVATLEQKLLAKEERVWSAFDRMDRDRNGVLSAEELAAGLKVPLRVAQQIVADADQNGDGFIDLDEFVDQFLPEDGAVAGGRRRGAKPPPPRMREPFPKPRPPPVALVAAAAGGAAGDKPIPRAHPAAEVGRASHLVPPRAEDSPASSVSSYNAGGVRTPSPTDAVAHPNMHATAAAGVVTVGTMASIGEGDIDLSGLGPATDSAASAGAGTGTGTDSAGAGTVTVAVVGVDGVPTHGATPTVTLPPHGAQGLLHPAGTHGHAYAHSPSSALQHPTSVLISASSPSSSSSSSASAEAALGDSSSSSSAGTVPNTLNANTGAGAGAGTAGAQPITPASIQILVGSPPMGASRTAAGNNSNSTAATSATGDSPSMRPWSFFPAVANVAGAPRGPSADSSPPLFPTGAGSVPSTAPGAAAANNSNINTGLPSLASLSLSTSAAPAAASAPVSTAAAHPANYGSTEMIRGETFTSGAVATAFDLLPSLMSPIDAERQRAAVYDSGSLRGVVGSLSQKFAAQARASGAGPALALPNSNAGAMGAGAGAGAARGSGSILGSGSAAASAGRPPRPPARGSAFAPGTGAGAKPAGAYTRVPDQGSSRDATPEIVAAAAPANPGAAAASAGAGGDAVHEFSHSHGLTEDDEDEEDGHADDAEVLAAQRGALRSAPGWRPSATAAAGKQTSSYTNSNSNSNSSNGSNSIVGAAPSAGARRDSLQAQKEAFAARTRDEEDAQRVRLNFAREAAEMLKASAVHQNSPHVPARGLTSGTGNGAALAVTDGGGNGARVGQGLGSGRGAMGTTAGTVDLIPDDDN